MSQVDKDNYLDVKEKIYKVNYIKKGVINKIIIFSGKKVETDKEKYFSSKEWAEIQEKNIPIEFTEQQIHIDDNITTVKIKILEEFKSNMSFEEIYLFAGVIEKINPIFLYKTLTQNKEFDVIKKKTVNKRYDLTKDRLDLFLLNIQGNLPGLVDKENFTYDDIISLQLENKSLIINKILGQQFFLTDSRLPNIYNPYDLMKFKGKLDKIKYTSVAPNNLILNTGDIHDNNINVCFARDVLDYLSTSHFDNNSIMKIYYPKLYDKNIYTIEDLEDNQSVLVENNKNYLTKENFQIYEVVDMFYNIYQQKKTNLNYIEKGIKSIKLSLYPVLDMKIPLEVIFKSIHATEITPLIKLNMLKYNITIN